MLLWSRRVQFPQSRQKNSRWKAWNYSVKAGKKFENKIISLRKRLSYRQSFSSDAKFTVLTNLPKKFDKSWIVFAQWPKQIKNLKLLENTSFFWKCCSCHGKFSSQNFAEIFFWNAYKKLVKARKFEKKKISFREIKIFPQNFPLDMYSSVLSTLPLNFCYIVIFFLSNVQKWLKIFFNTKFASKHSSRHVDFSLENPTENCLPKYQNFLPNIHK